MFDELKNYKNNGHFFFKSGNSLRDVSKDVPDLPGVYRDLPEYVEGLIMQIHFERYGSLPAWNNSF